MPRIVSEEVKQPIIKWYLERKTVTEYCNLSGRPLKMVKSIIKKYMETRNVEDQHKCEHKRRLLATEMHLVRIVKNQN